MKSVDRRLPTARRDSQRGMTLIEAIVAIFIFTVVFLTALSLYQTANRAYLRTDAATIQQQNVRFAMDRMTETLRDAGANYNPLGSSKLADEQIEGAWESAIFVRGDFDNSREDGSGGGTDLEDATWPMVTTGNDEIVGFVLWKNGAGTQDITLNMDLGAPRDAIYTDDDNISGETPVTVRVGPLTVDEQTNPPYQLVRVTFNAAGAAQYEIIAENIFRLQFDYFPETGTAEVADAADTEALNTERPVRKSIRRIGVTLVGMTDRADFGYEDPTDWGATPVVPETTKAHRKLSLTQTILSVNLGMKGKRHYEVPAIDVESPTSITACNGHCRRYWVYWPESATGGVQYELNITAPEDVANGLAAYELPLTLSDTEYFFEEPVSDVTAGVHRTFTFKVRAITGIEVGDWTGTVTRVGDVNNESIPSDVQNVEAAQAGGQLAMALRWDPVTENRDAISGDTCESSDGSTEAPDGDWAIEAVDLDDYKIYRSRTTGAATTDISHREWGELKNDATTAANFTDYTAAPCTDYFYRVKACDLCDTESQDFSAAMNPAVRFVGLADGEQPGKPDTPEVTGGLTYNGATGEYTFKLEWEHLTRTAGGTAAATSHYVIEQHRKLYGESGFTHQATEDIDVYEEDFGTGTKIVSGSITVPDTVSGRAASYEFRIRGIYDCGVSEGGLRDDGELSDPFTLGCTPSATHSVDLNSPSAGSVFVRPTDLVVPFTVRVGGADDDWAAAKVDIKLGGSIVHTLPAIEGPSSGNRYDFTWDTTGWGDGEYTAVATATTADGCMGYSDEVAFELDELDCGLSYDLNTDDLLPSTNATGLETEYTFKLVNSCSTDIVVNGMKLVWSGGRNTSAYITEIQYDGADVTAALNATTGASDTLIAFSTNVTIAAGQTSKFFKVVYSARKDGTTWSSIAAQNADTLEMDETLASSVKQVCAVDFDYTDDQLQPNTGNPKRYQLRFDVTNNCGADVIFDAIKMAWDVSTTVSYVQADGATISSTGLTAASGSTITFTSPLTITSGTTKTFRVFMSGDSNNGNWTSILFRHRAEQEFSESLGSGTSAPTASGLTTP